MSSGEEKTRAKIKELEFEYARTQKNKATEGHLGLIKAKIAKLQRELVSTQLFGIMITPTSPLQNFLFCLSLKSFEKSTANFAQVAY